MGVSARNCCCLLSFFGGQTLTSLLTCWAHCVNKCIVGGGGGGREGAEVVVSTHYTLL